MKKQVSITELCITMLILCFLGMIDIGKDPDYCDAYNDLQFDNDDDPDMIKERIHFMKHVEDICMQMTLFQKKVMHEKDIYMMESDMTISSIVRLLDDRINHDDYERVNTRLQMHENMLRDNITKKLEIRRQLFVLKLVSFLTPFLIGMRKRMKIPDLTRFLPDLSGNGVDKARSTFCLNVIKIFESNFVIIR